MRRLLLIIIFLNWNRIPLIQINSEISQIWLSKVTFSISPTRLYPEFDMVRQDDPQCCLASLEINLRQTEKLLRQRRRNQAKARHNLNNQWMELALKEKTLRENFLHFNSASSCDLIRLDSALFQQEIAFAPSIDNA